MWDWRTLPGTTTEQRNYSLKPGSDWGVRGTSTHAGGASDAEAGVSSFAYQRLGVTAKKSWFFLGDRMVALGSGIDAPTVTNPVWTTVNQCLLEGPVNYSTGSSTTMLGAARRNLASVDWVHHDGIGYFFPDGSGSTTVVGESRTGNWNTINTSLSTDPVTDDVFAIHLNHRYPVTGGSYAYVVMPVADAATMDASAPDDLVIERNDAVAQAASDSTTGYQAVNFWAAGTVAGITSDKPCSILVKRDADSTR